MFDDLEFDALTCFLFQFMIQVLNVGFIITACTLVDAVNMGFNVVLISIVSTIKGVWSYFLIRQLKQSSYPIAYGIWIGASLIMIIVYLITAIYWGEMSQCEKLPEGTSIDQYECRDKNAMESASGIATLLFLCEIFLAVTLVTRQSYLLRGYSTYSYSEEPESAYNDNVSVTNWWDEEDNVNEPLLDSASQKSEVCVIS